MGYKVLVDEVTVHKTITSFPQPDGSTVHQNGMGQTYYRDDVIPDDDIAVDWKEALESGEGKLNDSLSHVLEKTGDEGGVSSRAAGVPFVGYDDMEEDDVLAALKALPSAAQQRVKEYEATRDEPRERIVGYNTGFGESPMDRMEGKVSGDLQEATEKPSARIATREVNVDDNEVKAGEGVTGTGDPQKPYGAEADKEKGDVKGQGLKSRRGRRDRQPKPPEGPGTTSLSRSNDE